MKKSPPDMPPDSALWHKVVKTVKPYHAPKSRAAAPGGAGADRGPAGFARKAAETPNKVLRSLPDAVPAAAGFDRATATRLKKGKLVIEGRLDLHGMTQAQAHQALSRFIQQAVAADRRTVLVITGKGERGSGVLRQKLPLWLEESGSVLAVTQAQPRDGGGGAFYVRLRKSRKK